MMMKEEGINGVWEHACDSCRSAACAVYCPADSAYLCAGCDARVHAANRVASRHERVWVCQACERAPAAITCKADAAALCAACDAVIHSANPLARRHHRVPILPISAGCLVGPTSPPPARRHLGGQAAAAEEEEEEDGEDEEASWLMVNSGGNGGNQSGNYNNCNNGFLLGGEVDVFLDLVEYNNSRAENQNQYSHQEPQQVRGKNDATNSIVPVKCNGGNEHRQQQQQQQGFQMEMEMDYGSSKDGYCYTASLSHSVSISSMDASVVPDSTMTEISDSHSRPSKGMIDLFSGLPLQMPHRFTPMNREARVLRYREKRKTRKFEKTIRYASRKAYAETRPRIKGRFAKRSDVELEVDQMFSTSVMNESGYGIVPSF